MIGGRVIRLTVTEAPRHTAFDLAGLGGRIHTLRAFRRARDGAPQGRGCWERSRWPAAKFEVTSAKSDLRNEQREKRT